MDKEYKCKDCWRCCNYSAYYTKGKTKFHRVNFGSCRQSQKIVNKHDTCNMWVLKQNSNIDYRKKVCLQKLHELLFQLTEIRQILQEDNKDEM